MTTYHFGIAINHYVELEERTKELEEFMKSNGIDFQRNYLCHEYLGVVYFQVFDMNDLNLIRLLNDDVLTGQKLKDIADRCFKVSYQG